MKKKRQPPTNDAPESAQGSTGDTKSGEPRHESPAAEADGEGLGFPVVGVGASAGGLEALETLFENLPERTGMAFVVVTHQHPGHTSMLASLLARKTSLPVVEVGDWMKLEPDHVYVDLPGGQLGIRSGRLRRVDAGSSDPPHLPIDYFFKALAEDQKERSICIVLSGTGADGTLGLKAIKGESGMAMVQQAASAKYSGMPESAQATGLADFVLPPAEMPKQLLAYAKSMRFGAAAAGAVADVPDDSLQKIFILLRSRTGHDFSNYKTTTIRRRIVRRMSVHQIQSPAQYVSHLREHPQEIDILFKELLISVTSFFRDPEAFDILAQDILPGLLKSRPDNYTLRVWVPGCATGEEVYSLAILLREVVEISKRRIEVQVFGTDLDAEAINFARRGQYPDGISGDVIVRRLDRFFLSADGGYRIRKDIREMAIFAQQNVIKDAPFSKLDFISCRNLMIYLNSDLQRKLLPVFHYSLKPGGLLFLGPSETIGNFSDLFEPVDKRWKIFRRKESPLAARTIMEFPAETPPLSNDETHQPPARAAREAGVSGLVNRLLLSRFAPASVVVNDRGDVVFIHGRTGRYLEPAAGQPRLNIHEMAREGLQLELGSALRQAAMDTSEVLRENVRVRTNGDFSYIDLTVARLSEPESLRNLYLVTFRDRPAPSDTGKRSVRAARSGRVEELERDLRHTKESLQTTIEELETSNEELKSTNEELQSTNEELQSTNEELETSKEEMQSLNEELSTVNAELHSKVEELSRANDDMQNLLNSTEIATIFLDRNLHINRFTEQAKRLINLIQTDVGRPLADLSSRLRYERLVDDCCDVLRTLVFKQVEVRCQNLDWYLMRIMPYRTAENVIDGLVLTFVDINPVKKAEEELCQAKERLEFDLDAMTRLQDIYACSFRSGTTRQILDEVLRAAMFIAGTDMGNLQIVDPASRKLRIVSHVGLDEDWLAYWRDVDYLQGTCGAALRRGERVIVENTSTSMLLAAPEMREVFAKAGIMAVQSTPLIDSKREVIGMISTHFRTPHRPDERTLRLLDLLAREAADILGRKSALHDEESGGTGTR